MSVLAIVQARLGSSRLPNKALADICGRPMLDRVMERVEQIRGIDVKVVAVPKSDVKGFLSQSVFPFLYHLATAYVAPDVPENDVLSRFAAVAERYPACDTIMRICGDCPLLDPRIAEDVLQFYMDAHAWYAWNVHQDYTDGEDVEVFKREALLRAHREATDPSDREHVTSWIRRNYPVVTLKPTGPRRPKVSVDTEEDLERVRAIYAQLV